MPGRRVVSAGTRAATLAARLTDLEEADRAHRQSGHAPRVDYSLTERGRELCGVLTNVLRRGNRAPQ